MAFYGPTFPNEAHSETLTNGRHRFGNRSANMFFVRPARHIACPRRLKYIRDIKTGYIPVVEDSAFFNRASYKHVLQTMNDDKTNQPNNLALYNSADAWRQELMQFAQQVKYSLISADEQEQHLRQIRTARSARTQPKRSNSLLARFNPEDNDEQNVSKRLLYRRGSQRTKVLATPKQTNEKSEQEQTNNEENQDPGIWLIPILCYVLQTDNILEAQDWLINANPTEKRLAMELISRTMHDMQNYENDLSLDTSTSDFSAITTTTTNSGTTNLNNVYWPYKLWQKQEKDRQQQQQQMQNLLKQSKSSSHPSSTSVNGDNNETTCERATSPIRMVTPAKRTISTPNNHHHHPFPIETTIIERPTTRSTHTRSPSIAITRQNHSSQTDRPTTVEKRPKSRIPTPGFKTGNDSVSRRSHRVTTSLNHSIDTDRSSVISSLRGKTPLI